MFYYLCTDRYNAVFLVLLLFFFIFHRHGIPIKIRIANQFPCHLRTTGITIWLTITGFTRYPDEITVVYGRVTGRDAR